MKIIVVGAAGGEVTGSAYSVQIDRARILVDAGMFQGGKDSEAKNRIPAGVSLHALDAVVLTHAHLDHTGRVPLLIIAAESLPPPQPSISPNSFSRTPQNPDPGR